MIVTKTIKTKDLGILDGYTWQASAILTNGNIGIKLIQECDYRITSICFTVSGELDFNDKVFTEILIKWFKGSEYELPDKLI